MVPVYVKGGAWSNIEDEILKAAVSKYGLNQWSRVASLLARKTAKQAKARWNEYLDPRIRTSDWSAEEDEKLLNLARLMPNQWRSIASKIGRTATQAIERYQRILDDSEVNVSNIDLGLSGPGIETSASVGASKDLQIGDLNVNPETKVARPDAIDLDEDEKEMLSEARARLANTQGKKATRKARERMLEQSKRIALLQKRRELKQAGINTKLKAPKKKFKTQIDYNADIAFEHKPVGGFYDTTEENNDNENLLNNFNRQVQTSGLKDKESKRDRRPRDNKEGGGQISIEKQDDPTEVKRRKLELSAPKFRDDMDTSMIQSETQKDELKAAGIDDRIYEAAKKIRESKLEKSALLTKEDDEAKFEDEQLEDSRQETPVENESTAETSKFSLRDKFASLPKPKNDFEILENEEIEKGEEPQEKTRIIIEDEGEAERLRNIDKERERQKALLRRSLAVQKSLVIPNVDSSIKLRPLDNDKISKSVDSEILKLIKSDYSKVHKVSGVPLLGDLDDESRSRVEDEIKNVIDEGALEDFQNTFSSLHTSKSSLGKIENSALIPELQDLLSATNKLEKKLELQFGGYLKRNEVLGEEAIQLLDDLKDADRALAAFEHLHNSETISIKMRTDTLQEEVNALVHGEQVGQERYLEVKRTRPSEI